MMGALTTLWVLFLGMVAAFAMYFFVHGVAYVMMLVVP